MGKTFYSTHQVEVARDLKKNGISAKKIAKRLNISDSTILRWTIDLSPEHQNHLHAKRRQILAKNRSSELVTQDPLTKYRAKVLASLLYWCEGSKYPSSNFIAFSNSDKELVQSFLYLFRLGFGPKEERLRVHLQLHTTHDKDSITNAWSSILNIPAIQFYKPTITKPGQKMKRVNYMGTCTLRYYDVDTLLEITGIFEAFSKNLLSA